MVPLDLLEKYSEMLFGMVERKVDKLLMVRLSQAHASSVPWEAPPSKSHESMPSS